MLQTKHKMNYTEVFSRPLILEVNNTHLALGDEKFISFLCSILPDHASEIMAEKLPVDKIKAGVLRASIIMSESHLIEELQRSRQLNPSFSADDFLNLVKMVADEFETDYQSILISRENTYIRKVCLWVLTDLMRSVHRIEMKKIPQFLKKDVKTVWSYNTCFLKLSAKNEADLAVINKHKTLRTNILNSFQ